jgi:hypothetical protein
MSVHPVTSAGTQLRRAGMAGAGCRFWLAKGAVLARAGVTIEGCLRLSPDLGCADSVPSTVHPLSSRLRAYEDRSKLLLGLKPAESSKTACGGPLLPSRRRTSRRGLKMPRSRHVPKVISGRLTRAQTSSLPNSGMRTEDGKDASD